MADHPQSRVTQSGSRSALEDIGHLTRKICSIWGTPELDVFVSGLIMDARDGARHGLPLEVASDILFLAQTNKMIRAMDLSRKLSISVEEAYRRIDEGDQARLKIDPLDDPQVSHDTITRLDLAAWVPARRSAMSRAGSQARGLGQFLWLLKRSKWVLGAIVLLLFVKYVWPIVKPLI